MGAPILAYGFRPFFLAAGLYACLSMSAWLVWLGLDLIQLEVPEGAVVMPLYQWHGHEMLFGFATAVIAGFLLTAVPNWSGGEPLRGAPLAALAALWLAGRLALITAATLPPWLTALVDLAFLPVLGLTVAAPLIRAGAWRNMVFLALLGILFAANLLVHLELMGLSRQGAASGHLLAINLIVLLITIVGGRIVPSFTANWLEKEGLSARPRGRPWLDALTLAATAAVLVVDLVGVDDEARGILALAAAALHFARLAGWQTRRVLRTPMLWILHLGYGWLVVAFALKGLALTTGALSELAALHAFTAGAIGSMTLGVMTRAALGHSGRALEAQPAIVAAYLLVSAGAALRVAGPALLPQLYTPVMLLSGGLWALAFAIFAVVYWPILTRPRIDDGAG